MTLHHHHLTGGGKPYPDAVDRALAAAARITPRGPDIWRDVAKRRSGLKFDWSLVDHAVSPHRMVAHGRTWTRWGGWRESDRAWDRLNEAAIAKMAGLDVRRQDGLGCE